MINFYKRKLFGILAVLLAGMFCLIPNVGCTPNLEGDIAGESLLKVCFVDVGDGDCIIIKLPDQKTMLIDCGDDYTSNYSNITKEFTKLKIDKIDYFVLTHPDIDHMGNAINILNNFKVLNLYVPNIPNVVMEYFPALEQIKIKAQEKQVEIIHTQMLMQITGDEYFMGFLSPSNDYQDEQSPINQIKLNPTSEDSINGVSSVIYLECYGRRFLFMGDCGKEQEQFIEEKYKVNFYQNYFTGKGKKLNFQTIDFLKVGHHGSNNASGTDFLRLLMPKYAVVSTGAFMGNPSTQTLERIISVNPACQILRTDTLGTISIGVTAKGAIEIG